MVSMVTLLTLAAYSSFVRSFQKCFHCEHTFLNSIHGNTTDTCRLIFVRSNINVICFYIQCYLFLGIKLLSLALRFFFVFVRFQNDTVYYSKIFRKILEIYSKFGQILLQIYLEFWQILLLYSEFKQILLYSEYWQILLQISLL